MDVLYFIAAAILLTASDTTSTLQCLSMCSETAALRAAVDSSSTEYCGLTSELIFCLDSNKLNCYSGNDSDIANARAAEVRNAYYSSCGITESDITACATAIYGQCVAEFTVASGHLFKQEYTKYCSLVGNYLTCIKGQITEKCTNKKITPKNAVGNLVAVYGSNICKGDNADFEECKAILSKECDLSWNCSTVETLASCTDNIICPTTAGKTRVQAFINTTYVAPCKQAQDAALCPNKLRQCSDKLISAGNRLKKFDAPGCQTELNTAMACFDQITGCGNIGNNKEVYKDICRSKIPPGFGMLSACPNMLSCMTQFNMSDIQNVQSTCGMIGDFLDCFHTTLVECGVVLKTTYSFQDLKGIITTGCKDFIQEKLYNCSEFTQCTQFFMLLMRTQVVRPTSPELFCRYFKAYAMCAKYTTSTCGLDSNARYKSSVSHMITELDKKCHNADVYIPECPAAASCKSNLNLPITTSPFEIFSAVCQGLPRGLSCLDSKASECQLTGLESYSYASLSTGITEFCKVVTDNIAIGACNAFTQCLTTVGIENVNTLYTDPKFLCRLLTKSVACAAWNAPKCLPSNPEAKTSFNIILQKWYSKCPYTTLPDLPCPKALECLNEISSFVGYSAKSVIEICSKMKPVMLCMQAALESCSVNPASSYGFRQVGDYFEKSCNILKKSDYSELKNCKSLDSCIRQIDLPQSSNSDKIYLDPSYWCRVVRDTATCVYKSGCRVNKETQLRVESSDIVNLVNTKCPAEGFKKITVQVGAASAVVISMSVLIISSLIQTVL